MNPLDVPTDREIRVRRLPIIQMAKRMTEAGELNGVAYAPGDIQVRAPNNDVRFYKPADFSIFERA